MTEARSPCRSRQGAGPQALIFSSSAHLISCPRLQGAGALPGAASPAWRGPSLTLPCGQRGWKVMARLGVHRGMGPHGAWVPQSTVRNAAPRRENDRCPLYDKPPPVSCPTGCSGWGNVAAWRGGGYSAHLGPRSTGTVRGGRAGLCEGEPMMLARVVQGRPEDGTGAGRRSSRPACGKAPFWRQRMG